MNKMKSSMTGVTLLEIMLVLAIAAMVIVMSVRYYQSASTNQQVNSMLQTFQAITAAADGLAQGTGSYTAVNQDAIKSLMPGGNMNAPWGGAITVADGAATSYEVSVAAPPAQVCTLIVPRLEANSSFTSVSCTGGASGSLSYTYSSSAAS